MISFVKLRSLVCTCGAALVLASACGGTTRKFDAPANVEESGDDDYQALLSRYVDGKGRVDYKRWKASLADVAVLDRHLRRLAATSPDSRPAAYQTGSAKLSYWINLYNVLVIREVLRRWPLASVRDVRESAGSYFVPGKGFFRDLRFRIGGRTLSLDDLEHRILRGRFGDARIHFAINCGSASCPVLRRDAFDPNRLEAQLESASRAFINDTRNVEIDHGQRRIVLSKIFDWYRDDFVTFSKERSPNKKGSLVAFLVTYAKPKLARALLQASRSRYKIDFRRYDWRVNRQARTTTNTGTKPGIRPGTRMPDVAFRLRGGGMWKPSDSRGRVVILEFWASYCRPCRESFPALQELWQRRRSDGLDVVAVSLDEDPELIAAFLKQTGASFPVAIDPNQKTYERPLVIRSLPTEIVIDREGIVRHRHDGSQPGLVKQLEAEVDALLSQR